MLLLNQKGVSHINKLRSLEVIKDKLITTTNMQLLQASNLRHSIVFILFRKCASRIKTLRLLICKYIDFSKIILIRNTFNEVRLFESFIVFCIE